MKPGVRQRFSRPVAQYRHSPQVSMMYGLTRSPTAQPSTPSPSSCDVARDLDAERVRKLDRETRDAVADVDVEVVERARP